MSYRSIGDDSFMQKKAELMDTGYAILEYSADATCFPKKLLEIAALPSNYMRMSLHAVMAWVHSTFNTE